MRILGAGIAPEAVDRVKRGLVMTFSHGLTRRGVLKAGAAGAGFVAAPWIANAQAADAIKMSLEFRIYGGNAPMFHGVEAGIFKAHGIDCTPEGSSGSGESVTRVASGTHQFGLADASTVVEFAARNPGVAPKIVMTVFDKFPAVVLSLKRKPIKSLEDLKTAKLGTGTADAGSKIMPALLALNKIDINAINRTVVDVKLRDTMLLKGDVDAVIAFDYTAIFNLTENGVKMEDINLLYYSDYGFNFPGNSLIVSPALIEKNPDLVKRVALATAKAWVSAAKQRDQAIAAVTKRDGLLNAAVERQRMDWVLDKLVLTPSVKQSGLGTVTTERLTQGIGVLKEGFQLTNPPTVDQIYTTAFLPPQADRMFG
jgi:NitT/TauT family transport system substrate-binding protein